MSILIYFLDLSWRILNILLLNHVLIDKICDKLISSTSFTILAHLREKADKKNEANEDRDKAHKQKLYEQSLLFNLNRSLVGFPV